MLLHANSNFPSGNLIYSLEAHKIVDEGDQIKGDDMWESEVEW